jgi:ornithine--oxo-acid transaminase
MRSSLCGQAKRIVQKEFRFSAPNYISLPVVLKRTKDIYAWDVSGKKYYDFLSAYSAVNQGHLHPRIVGAAIQQLQNTSITSRAFHNNIFPEFAEKITQLCDYDNVLPMNTGAEGVETACKIARKWGYETKMIPWNKSIIVSAKNCFHGRTYMSISLNSDHDARHNFGPLMDNVLHIEYNNIIELEAMFEKFGHLMCGIILEPIQGEGGIIIPDKNYLPTVQALCKKHNVLFIADEIQTGLGRTGKMFAYEWDNVRPDILILGKALGGGIYPISAVLADKDKMHSLSIGTHGSTFGGNPLGCKIAIAALDVIQKEGLVEKSNYLGKQFREKINHFDSSDILEVRGRGLMNGVEIKNSARFDGNQFCQYLAFKKRILTKATRENTIRFTPPLTFPEKKFNICIDKINSAITELGSVHI